MKKKIEIILYIFLEDRGVTMVTNKSKHPQKNFNTWKLNNMSPKQ